MFLFHLYNPWLSEKFMSTLLRFLGYPQVFQECYKSKGLELSFSTFLSPHRSFIYLFFSVTIQSGVNIVVSTTMP